MTMETVLWGCLMAFAGATAVLAVVVLVLVFGQRGYEDES